LLWGLLGVILSGISLSIVRALAPIDESTEYDLITVFIYLWVLYWIYRKSKQNHIQVNWFLQKGRNVRVLELLGLVITLLLFSIGSLLFLAYLLAHISPSLLGSTLLKEETRPSGFPLLILNQALDVLIVIVLAPVIEELLFRGVLLNRCAAKWGMKKGILVSSAAFAILHFEMIGAFLFAICMAILYLKTRTLLVPMAAHALNNGIIVAARFWPWSNTDSSTSTTIEAFRSDGWLGGIFLAATLPVVVLYIYRNWPKRDAASPYMEQVSEDAGRLNGW